MAHRLAREAEAELDEIWYYVATESDSTEIADRLIDSLPTDLSCWPATLTWAGLVTETCAPACGAFPWARLSSSIASRAKTC